MATYAIFENTGGLIVNRIVLDNLSQWQIPPGHSAVNDTNSPMAIGGKYISGVYVPPPDPAKFSPVIEQVSSRQFWTQMAVLNLISENEAIKALKGDIPHVIAQFIDTLPIEKRFQTRMIFEASDFQRFRVSSDLQACFSLSPEAVDQFFKNAAAL
jgi:hypothetical protein